MHEMNKEILGRFLQQALTSYRLVPLLYQVMCVPADRNGQAHNSADTELFRILADRGYTGTPVEVYEALDWHCKWIEYTMADFLAYCNVMRVKPGQRMAVYLEAMSEIAKSPLLNWEVSAFCTGIENPTIMSIGCGNMPYLRQIREANVGHITYIGVDKRALDIVHNLSKEPTHLDVQLYQADFQCDVLPIGLHDIFPKVDTIFFGNCLHNFLNPLTLLRTLLEHCPRLSSVMILEYKPDSIMNLCFDFHMTIHKVGTSAIPDLAYFEQALVDTTWKARSVLASNQHVMYRIGV